uniref:Malonyl CoA-acyl carrier protein transacylase n=1 Tax=uncultured Chloroflexota bacterium TaxID=166587 RepID=H5SMY0_9CHLR|nr:malonyl CoA-acyl carrier protein transacylase [uncultured Chloroflexota bacterium]
MKLLPEQTVFVFPGQGSQSVGMGKALAERFPLARETFEEADELLGFPLSRLMWEGPEAELNDTLHTQPALFVHSLAVYRVFASLYPDFQPLAMAGHSLGELSALTAAGAMEFADGLRLARRRGELMKQAGEQNPGGMAAVLGLDLPTLEEICARSSTPQEWVQVANDNAPGQVVISGAHAALQRAMETARAAGARRVIPLAVSIAAHSQLMQPAQEEFNRALERLPLTAPRVPVIGNVQAQPLTTAEAARADLAAQLTRRVRWVESVQTLIQMGGRYFVEMGNGSVLCGLIRRIDGAVNTFSLSSPADFEALLAA